jgi:NADPH-dependent 2,4-dienoyl-CoA reductase/sulfur reductase-like enzyme
MFLRSPYRGSNIGGPELKLTLQDYERQSQRPLPLPIPVDRFVDYGRWFQERAVPDLDRREVRNVESSDGGFRVEVDDDTFEAARVVVAAGVGTFAYRPSEYASLEPDAVSHALDHHDLSRFRGARVSVIGGGQSALESAALLHEVGADVDVLVRADSVRWLEPGSKRHQMFLVKDILYAPPDVGPALVSQLNARPGLFRYLSQSLTERIDHRSVAPAGAVWLPDRLVKVRIRTGVSVNAASRSGEGVQLDLSDGTRQTVDHVFLGTGYRVDLANYSFLHPALVRGITCIRGYPRLSESFETTVPGLHITGAPAAYTFGPLMRFVAGSAFAGRTIARGLAR